MEKHKHMVEIEKFQMNIRKQNLKSWHILFKMPKMPIKLNVRYVKIQDVSMFFWKSEIK